jgi:hypothetical protein
MFASYTRHSCQTSVPISVAHMQTSKPNLPPRDNGRLAIAPISLQPAESNFVIRHDLLTGHTRPKGWKPACIEIIFRSRQTRRILKCEFILVTATHCGATVRSGDVRW